jgi:hypothetical protein
VSIHTVASRDFARDVGQAKRLAAQGPVFITDRGRPAFALLKIEDYYELSGGNRETSLLDFMHGEEMPRTDGIDFEPPRAHIELKVPRK